MKWILAVTCCLFTFLLGSFLVGNKSPTEPPSIAVVSEPVAKISGQTPKRLELPTPASKPGTISREDLNAYAKYLPEPIYPPAAKAVKAGGIVAVKVVISKEGYVISTEAISGHPLLRSAAEGSARKAIFDQTFMDSLPLSVCGCYGGILKYNFQT